MVMKYLKLQKYNWKGRSKTELTGKSPLRGKGPHWNVVPSKKKKKKKKKDEAEEEENKKRGGGGRGGG